MNFQQSEKNIKNTYNINYLLYNNNYFEALKGSEEIFYFMPGLRYFGSLNNIIFGETILGYFLICTFIPFIFYKILFAKEVNNLTVRAEYKGDKQGFKAATKPFNKKSNRQIKDIIGKEKMKKMNQYFKSKK